MRGLLELARSLGLETIAEGIETDAQWHSLSLDGCLLGQGYLFGKPRDERVATELLERQWRLDRGKRCSIGRVLRSGTRRRRARRARVP